MRSTAIATTGAALPTETVLNPTLFSLLTNLFGRPIVANRGVGMYASEVPDPLRPGKSRNQVLTSGEYYRVNCPFCQDTGRRLWINHTFGQPQNGYRQTWAAHCYNEKCLASEENRKRLKDMIFSVFGPGRAEPMQISPGEGDGEIHEAAMPGTCIPLRQLPTDHVARRYMVGRHFDPDHLSDRWGVCYCVDAPRPYTMARNRIIAPIYMDGMLIGWQGRWPDDINWKQAGIPKYYNLPNMPKSRTFYNYEAAKNWPFVVIMEGYTHVWRVGDPGLALLGKTMSYWQQMLLVHTWPKKPVFLLLDPDAEEEMRGIIRDLSAQPDLWLIPTPIPPGSDAADYTHEGIVGIIRARAREVGIDLAPW